MVLPQELLQSLEGAPGFERAQFEQVHSSGAQVTSIRINEQKFSPEALTGVTKGSMPDPVPWTTLGYYLPHRPSFTFDPLFHAGCYYVQ